MKVRTHFPVRHFRELFTMLFRSKVAESSSNEISEYDLIEALLIVESVCIHRLTGDPKEWKGDKKRKYKYLFKSIQIECKETIREYFTCDGVPARGVTINKFNTLILESIFNILQLAGPERSLNLITSLRKAIERDLQNMRDIHYDDAVIARMILDNHSKKRAENRRKPKKMTTNDRLEMIEMVVENIQPA